MFGFMSYELRLRLPARCVRCFVVHLPLRPHRFPLFILRSQPSGKKPSSNGLDELIRFSFFYDHTRRQQNVHHNRKTFVGRG